MLGAKITDSTLQRPTEFSQALTERYGCPVVTLVAASGALSSHSVACGSS